MKRMSTRQRLQLAERLELSERERNIRAAEIKARIFNLEFKPNTMAEYVRAVQASNDRLSPLDAGRAS